MAVQVLICLDPVRLSQLLVDIDYATCGALLLNDVPQLYEQLALARASHPHKDLNDALADEGANAVEILPSDYLSHALPPCSALLWI